MLVLLPTRERLRLSVGVSVEGSRAWGWGPWGERGGEQGLRTGSWGERGGEQSLGTGSWGERGGEQGLGSAGAVGCALRVRPLPPCLWVTVRSCPGEQTAVVLPRRGEVVLSQQVSPQTPALRDAQSRCRHAAPGPPSP